MRLRPLRADMVQYMRKRNLTRKYAKASRLFELNSRHPSLHFELLEPRERGVHSFRIDRKYRALFLLVAPDEAEVFSITNHYKK